MNELQYSKELFKCVRCGACKALCPTYLTFLDEAMGARGRVAMLGAVNADRLEPTGGLSEKIFSCILCGACKDQCPTGIDILETIYHGRIKLKDFYGRGRLLRKAVKFSLPMMNSVFFVLRSLQKILYHPLYRTGRLPYIPEIARVPFKNSAQVYKNTKRIGRVAIFAGCSVNYFHPHLGDSLLNILLAKGYEVIVLKGEVCCGSPMRAMGLEENAIALAKKNTGLFNKIRAEAILSMCPTCTMVIRKEYPLLIGGSIEKIMDVNEFFIKNGMLKGLKISPRAITYHDPCHLNYGLGIRNEPREILKNIEGAEFVEMQDAGDCCGFGGFFSVSFRSLSEKIGSKKIESISNTRAKTLVTSCPGCMMQLENIKRMGNLNIDIVHMVEMVDEAMQG
ncbi:MAG: (Fe-S)-binding protein [Nitrospirae bacterium]|nr:(Fe-S)-binding protein [Nitrospirota bacterium]